MVDRNDDGEKDREKTLMLLELREKWELLRANVCRNNQQQSICGLITFGQKVQPLS